MEIKSNLNGNIKFIRESNNLSQGDFGKIIGKGASLVSAYENGISTPPLNIMQIISDKFNYSLDDLVNLNLQGVGDSNNNVKKSIENGNLKGNPNDNLFSNRQKKIDSLIETESKQIMNEIFGDYGQGSIAESETILKPSENMDFQLFVISALEHLDMLYLVVKLLLDNDYQFSKKEIKELYYYEKIVRHSEEIGLNDASITIKKFLQISNIVHFKLYLQLNSYTIELKKVLGIDEVDNFETIFNKSDKE